ncbi:MAG: hypothetical protein LUQ71_00790 [Methanoregula sp.]|nr:hypothetical protein [Methanoregula sp.]
MNDNTGQIIEELVSEIWARPIEDYLSSEEFVRFCQEHELSDEWRKYLELSRDNPALYGNSTGKNAFTRFLNHICHHRPGEFLSLFSRLLADFSRGLSCYLPVEKIRSSLLRLGYPADRIDPSLFILRIKQVPAPDLSDDCCPARDKDPDALK